MRRKHEDVFGHKISCWDSGEKLADRYTVVYLDLEENGRVPYVAMGETPRHPGGFLQHGEMPVDMVAYKGLGGAFDKRIKFSELPEECQRAFKDDLSD